MFSHQKLRCYMVALSLAKAVPALIERWPAGNGNLADQLKRAVVSISLNIAEGNGRYYPKERKRFFRIAIGSINECVAIMDIVNALKLVTDDEYVYFSDQLLQTLKMLYKLS